MWHFHLVSFINLSLDLKCFHWKCYVQNSIKYQKILILVLIISSRSFFLPLSLLPSFFSFSLFPFSFLFLFFPNRKHQSWAIVSSSSVGCLWTALHTPLTWPQWHLCASHSAGLLNASIVRLPLLLPTVHCWGSRNISREKKRSCLCLGTFWQLYEGKVRKQMYVISCKIYIKDQLCAPPCSKHYERM